MLARVPCSSCRRPGFVTSFFLLYVRRRYETMNLRPGTCSNAPDQSKMARVKRRCGHGKPKQSVRFAQNRRSNGGKRCVRQGLQADPPVIVVAGSLKDTIPCGLPQSSMPCMQLVWAKTTPRTPTISCSLAHPMDNIQNRNHRDLTSSLVPMLIWLKILSRANPPLKRNNATVTLASRVMPSISNAQYGPDGHDTEDDIRAILIRAMP